MTETVWVTFDDDGRINRCFSGPANCPGEWVAIEIAADDPRVADFKQSVYDG